MGRLAYVILKVSKLTPDYIPPYRDIIPKRVVLVLEHPKKNFNFLKSN